jgi:hypothetical protein
MITVLDPTHGEPPAEFTMAPRLTGLDGAVVGIVSNGKQGTAPFFDGLEERLRELGAAEVERVTKPNYSAPAPREVMDRAARWNALVAGVGD